MKLVQETAACLLGGGIFLGTSYISSVMPLLHKKPFMLLPIPECKPGDKVFYLEESNEIFTSYDSFFERSILLTSTLFTCEFTGKTGLTYQEALQSEKEALRTLDNFPKTLESAIMYLIDMFSYRGRFDDLLNDIALFIKDRYVIGETCFFTGVSNKRLQVRITDASLEGQWIPPENFDPKKETIAPASKYFRYSAVIVESDGDDGQDCFSNIKPSQLSRAKHMVSRPRLKLLLRTCCDVKGDRYTVKKRLVDEHKLATLGWRSFFAGPEPKFPKTPMQRMRRLAENCLNFKCKDSARVSRHNDGEAASSMLNQNTGRCSRSNQSGDKETPKTKRGTSTPKLSERKRQKIAAQQDDLKFAFDSACDLNIDISKYRQHDRLLSGSEISELKNAVKTAKKKQREAAREEKRQRVRDKRDWNRKRDDLECDDLTPLPIFNNVPLPSWMSEEEFADYVTIVQFFHSFSDMLPFDEVPGLTRVTLADVIRAIRCNDPQFSSFANLMKILLSARTDLADEEDGDEADMNNKEEISLIQLQNCDPAHPLFGEAIKSITKLHEDVRATHGLSVRHLPIDWMTLSESLRLCIETSGYYTGQSTHRHRLFSRGNYKGYEDPGFVFKMEHPEVMDILERGTVFDLAPSDRLGLLNTIIAQLLSYSKFRSSHEERLNQMWERKRELRKFRAWDQTQEQEAKEALLVLEYEQEHPSEEASVSKHSQTSDETLQLITMLKAVRESLRYDQDQLETLLLNGINYSELVMDDILTARDLQRKVAHEVEQENLKKIYDMATTIGSLHLGRDRAYRNYFLIDALPAVLVENPSEADHIGECLEATPTPVYGGEISTREVLCCTGDMNNCPVHAKKSSRPRWSIIDSTDVLEKVLKACNPRGLRESDLSDEIQYFKQRIDEVINWPKENGIEYSDIFMTNEIDPSTMRDSIDWHQEMRELLLDLEEKMSQGMLGLLPSHINRDKWREALKNNGDITEILTETDDVVIDGEVFIERANMARLSPVQKLAVAFLILVQGIKPNFLQEPFVMQNTESDGTPRLSNVFFDWQRRLFQCHSISGLSLFLSTLESSILWDKSRLHGKCRRCRRKGVAESLVLCSQCVRCYHQECVNVGNDIDFLHWLCSDCLATNKKKRAAEMRKTVKDQFYEQQMDFENYCERYDDVKALDEVDENSLLNISADSTDSRYSHSSLNRSRGRVLKRSSHAFSESSLDIPLNTSRRQSSRSIPNPQNGSLSENDQGQDVAAREPSAKRKRSERGKKCIDNWSSVLPAYDSVPKDRLIVLEQFVRDVMKQEFAWPFLDPVDSKLVPDYYDVIMNPIDLRTMINRIKTFSYNSSKELLADMDLMVANCKAYNIEGSEIYECALAVEDYYKSRYKELFSGNFESTSGRSKTRR